MSRATRSVVLPHRLVLLTAVVLLAACAPGADDAGLANAGRAYLYETALGFVLQATLGARTPAAGGRFGTDRQHDKIGVDFDLGSHQCVCG